MPKHRTAGQYTLTKSQKFSMAGVAALGAAALAVSIVPGNASEASQAATAEISTSPAAFTVNKDVQASVTAQQVAAAKDADAAAKKAKAEADAKAKAEAEAKAKQEREEKEAASRAAARKPVYANNLDGWIRQALDIMKKEGIPGTYNGIYKNVMRESSGNPNAINNWDINAQNGVPSIGLLQIIKPTFDAYHVDGTEHNQYNPVANIVAASNYAADRYGSIDNVNSAY
ncbi:transglycosylase SLT domain-containing protein [Streptomyces sp. TRM66268-LWL]|uniref:Transglycosylase SLT domain-containing protein n=1 Tax=Streptomyces polyasparticus TaxID=2767826 RepID=A0ABR7S8K5_9ACTN|nr:transglycosylase SLT domain-containing protein [Streptomyces polyasparticus]MBC9711801.1 transglycosylase SLT domain-containing protein [Streptomyces polyasparticus]